MAEYVTLIEAAELEGVKYKTMAQRLSRNPDKFDTMTEKSENGGKDAVLVAVASLSKKARNAWKERAKLKELSGTISPEGEAQPEPEAPWYVEADVDWYIENYREQWYKGMELGNVIREFLQYDGANKTEYAEQYAQEHLGSGKRTLYRYVKAYNEACAWADKLQKESGVGFEFFKVLCLCRKPKESGTFPSIKPEVKQVIKNIWFNEDFAANLGTREMLYEKLTLVANVNKWEKIPSYQTVTRYITYLMEDEGMKNAHFLASKGSREYKNKVMVKGSRDTSGLKVMQIVMGDEHTFDCWVAYKQPNGKVIPIKPHLAAWVDMRSRAIMGDVLCKDANSDILKQSLLKMMYSEPGGIPEYLYIDNGKAKESQSIGEVKSFPISEAKMLKLLPEGIEDYIAILDKAKYLTFRQYVGKEDYYVTSANMMAPDGSDYAYAEDVRVSNRLVKAVRAYALNELQSEVDPGDLDASISILQANLNTPVEDAVDDKIISSGRLEIDTENLNILVDESIDVRVTYVPMGHVREMNLTFAVENPVSAS